jgi:hypothetical protein
MHRNSLRSTSMAIATRADLFEIIRTTGWMRRLRPDPCRTNGLVFEHRMSAMSRSGRICANAIT